MKSSSSFTYPPAGVTQYDLRVDSMNPSHHGWCSSGTELLQAALATDTEWVWHSGGSGG